MKIDKYVKFSLNKDEMITIDFIDDSDGINSVRFNFNDILIMADEIKKYKFKRGMKEIVNE